MPKSKDNKGRALKTGESQRKDLLYQYRYTDNLGKRQTVYAATLQELREKEPEIDEYAKSGVNYASGNITVVELLERYLALQQGRRYNTQVGYAFVLNLVKKEPFGQRIIRNIKASDAKLWFIKLSRDGRSFSTICSIRGVLKPAFQMAFEEDIIRKNPFVFKMDIIPNDTKKREAMTPQQQVDFMTFIRDDEHYCECYDEYVVLLETGVRISEFVGLTKNDLDFEKRRIHVDHQLVKRRTGEYYIEKTKTESGDRYIPMTDRCYESLRNILFNRPKPKVEMIVNGYTGFLFLDKKGKPKVALHFEHQMKRAVEKYNNTHDEPLPKITPHVFRHTFCTNMARAGMDVKSLQYLMGHSDVTVALNVYTHMNYEHAAESMAKIIDLQNEVLQMCP